MGKDKLYSLPALRGKRVRTVKIADLKVSSDPHVTLVTYGLGSCVAVTGYDPAKQIGALLHFLLPSQEYDRTPQYAPMKYADTGLAMLLKRLCQIGANTRRLIVKAAGAAHVLKATPSAQMDIGKRNYEALLAELDKHALTLHSKDVGGSSSRTAMLEIDTGILTIRTRGQIVRI